MSSLYLSRSRNARGQVFGEVFSHFLAPFRSHSRTNAGLSGLTDRILIDIGVDPRDVPSAEGYADSFRSAAKS